MAETRWLDRDEREAWLALAGMLFTLPTALEAQLLREEDLTMGDYMVLAMLSERSGEPLRMSELAVAAQTSQSRLSRIVARLEKSGYVTRAMDSSDRRAVMASLTEAGRAKIVAAAPRHVAHVRRLVIDRLSREQLRSLAGVGRELLGDRLPASVEPLPYPVAATATAAQLISRATG
jgi:DNA-binding MarR family transcriptional regulator